MMIFLKKISKTGLLLLFLCSRLAYSQETKEKLSFSFQDQSYEEAILSIEEETGLKFYFLREWLPETTVTGNFKQVPLEQVLSQVFDRTLLNYYVLGDRVILTRNSVIYDELPKNYFNEVQVDAEVADAEPLPNPVFYAEEQEPEDKKIETVVIGKAKEHQGQSKFQLSGYVTSAETGAPLTNLAVEVKNRKIGAVTDEHGYYELELPAGINLVQTSSLGNEDLIRRVVIYNDGVLNFRLEEDVEQLEEVMLESNRDENISSSITGAEEIDVEAIKNIPLVLGERDIFKVATTLPGISTAGEGAAGFNVRGGRADQNLILLDHAVVYNPAHFFGLFSAINPFTTGTVDIYKGSIPVEFGGRLSSVFDLRTEEANVENIEGEASVGPVTANLALEVPLIKEKAGLLLGIRSTYSGWILRSLDEESLQDKEAAFYDGILKYNHSLGKDTGLKTTLYYSKDRFSITSDSIYDYSNRLASLEFNHNFNDRNRGIFIISNSDYQFNIDYNSEFNSDFRSGYRINETAAKILWKRKINSKHDLTSGVSGKLYVVNPGQIEPVGDSFLEPMKIPEEKGLESSVFISDDFEVNEELLLSAGVRYSVFAALGPGVEPVYQQNAPRRPTSIVDTLHFGNFEKMATYGGPEVRFSARYKISSGFSVKAGYNTTRQYIHTLSNNTTASPTDTYRLSNGIIAPQEASQYSLGFYKNLQDNIYEMSLEGYFKTSDNLLDYKVGADLFLNRDLGSEVLQGEGRAFGMELLIKKTEGRLNGWVGYSYSRSLLKLDGEFPEEIVNSGDYFPSNYDKPHDVSVVANYKFTRRFSLSANFVYQTGRPVTYPVGKYSYGGAEYVMYSDRNKFRIPDYYRLDLSFNIEGNHKIEKLAHSFWNISVYNVLGRNNPYSVYFVTKDGEIQAYKSSIFSVPVPTITYNFKF